MQPEEKDTETKARDLPLTEIHRQAGGRIVDFAGFMMPLQYTGIVDEHHAVRKAAGLFDVSHMGEVLFTGPGALAAVDRLVTNNVAALGDGEILYTPICYADGGIVDDCLVYRRGAEEVLVVVNASNIDKDFDWFVENTTKVGGGAADVTLSNISDECGLIAIQGPEAIGITATVAGEVANTIAPFTMKQIEIAGVSCTASRTGYTGEDGFEILCPEAESPKVWTALFEAGTPRGLKPAGLGARDTLRLEAKLPLYGNDIDATTTPLEAGLGWTVKLKAGDFIGKQPLVAQKRDGLKRKLVSLVMRSRGIARHGHRICALGEGGEQGRASLAEEIGHVTSGTKSPTLGEAIALGYVPKKISKSGNRVAIDVRGKAVEAEVIKGAFYKRQDS